MRDLSCWLGRRKNLEMHLKKETDTNTQMSQKPIYSIHPVFILIFGLFTSFNALSQKHYYNRITPIAEEVFQRNFAIGLNTGTKALAGIDVAMQCSPRISMKLGYNFLDLAIMDYETNFNKYPVYVSIDLIIDQSNVEFTTEFLIYKNQIRAVVGAGYFFQNRVAVKGQLADSYEFNDIEFTPDEIGFVKGKVSFKSPVSPYIGIAFGGAVPKSKIGFSVHLGTYYKGRPDIDIKGTNLVRHNDENEPVLEDLLSEYRWWPVLAMRFSFKTSSNKKYINDHIPASKAVYGFRGF